ncbi:MAG: hypothetical protein CM1200mP14_22140 [Gammaproteobacteria bacterium]|nr:MAG: hypothetical protein CM1200mP14_22140 [Gammaproteobacteria bacterium]
MSSTLPTLDHYLPTLPELRWLILNANSPTNSSLYRVRHPRDDKVAQEHDAINLAQGFPDFSAPELLKEAACAAIRADINQYAITWGTGNLRQALAEKYAER